MAVAIDTRGPQAGQRTPVARLVLVVGVALVFLAVNFTAALTSPLLSDFRWVLLGGLSLVGLQEIWRLGGRTPVPFPVVAWLIFVLAAGASVSYSLIPQLSLYRTVSFILGLLGLVYGIGLWFRTQPGAWLRVLAVVNVGMLIATALTLPTARAWNGGLLQGPFFNPNSLGSALVLTLPGLLWLREQRRDVSWRPLSFYALDAAVVGNLIAIMLTRSRASILALALVLLLYAVFRSSRLAALVAFAALVIALASPSSAGSIAQNAVYKGRSSAEAAFTARQNQLQTTFDAAMSSPIYGYGFGTAKDVTTWAGGLSAVTTGREKANAYLGAVEEVGLIGALPLTLGVLMALWIGFRSAWRSRLTSDGVPAGLFIVALAAAVHTNFEAWLTSVGAFEAFFFWSTLGVLLMSTVSERSGDGSPSVRARAT